MKPFSVVIPVSKWDCELASRTLLSWLKLPTDDILLCVDDQVQPSLIGDTVNGDPRVRYVFVGVSPWKFRQAYVRRQGFKSAKHDVILTGDADVVPNLNVLRAVELAGEDGVGVVNVQMDMKGKHWRNFWRGVVRHLNHTAFHTGLYALYRPYWIETEDEESASVVPDPRTSNLAMVEYHGRTNNGILGEDVMVFEAMLDRYKTTSLPIVGGTEVREESNMKSSVQMKLAIRYIQSGRRMRSVLLAALLYGRWLTLWYYVSMKARGRQRGKGSRGPTEVRRRDDPDARASGRS
jgi:glycosyltransferase involved in cell wall biosynthesis